jgi:hypothetical protein
MASFLALLAFPRTAGVRVERVSVPGPNAVNLDATLVLPAGVPKALHVLAVHGCGGPFPMPGWLETGLLETGRPETGRPKTGRLDSAR